MARALRANRWDRRKKTQILIVLFCFSVERSGNKLEPIFQTETRLAYFVGPYLVIYWKAPKSRPVKDATLRKDHPPKQWRFSFINARIVSSQHDQTLNPLLVFFKFKINSRLLCQILKEFLYEFLGCM